MPTIRNTRAIRVFAALSMTAAIGLVMGSVQARSNQDAIDSCSTISPGSLEAYGRTIAAAHRSASADADKNGTSGEYAVAARNSRDLLKRAEDRAASATMDLQRSDPSVTTAAEAGTVKEHVRYSLEIVPQAAHWSLISEIYHDSPDARKAFEGSVKILEAGNRLFAEAGRCYMDGL